MNEHLTLNEVKGSNRTFKLNQPIKLEIETDEPDVIWLHHRESALQGFGDTLELAAVDFCEMFEMQYEGLVECDISYIHWSALNLRSVLIALVKVE